MVTVPILGIDRHISVLITFISIRGSESESEPVEKSYIVQESVSVSESESTSGSENKPLKVHAVWSFIARQQKSSSTHLQRVV